MGTDENPTKDKATANKNAAKSQETTFISRKDQLVEEARSFNERCVKRHSSLSTCYPYYNRSVRLGCEGGKVTAQNFKNYGT